MDYHLKFTPVLLLLHLVFFAKGYQYDCSRIEYNRCVNIADPLVKESHLIFPDNLNDIDLVCRTWNRFVDCLSAYTDKCFTYEQRTQFNKAVRSSIESVHQMCMDKRYQKEYLQHAPCLKSLITDRNYCGLQYNVLVDQVARGDDISRASLCCLHDRFKECVARETMKTCDRGAPLGPASRFSSQIIEKALSFLQNQCSNYIPNSADCDVIMKNEHSTDSLISSASSEVYPWSTIQEEIAKELPLSKKSTTPWLPSSSGQFTPIESEAPTSDVLGTRTRPSSYGRSSGWSDFNQNTQPIADSATQDVHSTFRPEFTTGGWVVSNQSPKIDLTDRVSTQNSNRGFSDTSFTDQGASSMQTWYPAAGDQIENEVEEPNQQGLVKPDNGVDRKMASAIATILAFILVLV